MLSFVVLLTFAHRISQVLHDRHVWKKRVFLEYESYIALLGSSPNTLFRIGPRLSVYADKPPVRAHKTSKKHEQARLASPIDPGGSQLFLYAELNHLLILLKYPPLSRYTERRIMKVRAKRISE